MALLKDTQIQGNLQLGNPASDPSHAVRSDDGRMSNARVPTSHTHTKSQITDAGTAIGKDVPASGNAAAGQVVLGNDTRLADARTPTTHTHTKSQITDAGTAIGKDFPATGDAAAGQVVLGNDSRLSDSRQPIAHSHATATQDTAGFLSALDKEKLDHLDDNLYWLAPVASFANLPLAGDQLNAMRVTADTGVQYRHISLTGTVTEQWAAPTISQASTIYIGDSARFVAISGGVKLEVKNSSGTWVQQLAWTEA